MKRDDNMKRDADLTLQELAAIGRLAIDAERARRGVLQARGLCRGLMREEFETTGKPPRAECRRVAAAAGEIGGAERQYKAARTKLGRAIGRHAG